MVKVGNSVLKGFLKHWVMRQRLMVKVGLSAQRFPQTLGYETEANGKGR